MITQYDSNLASAWILDIASSGSIKFQFPPRMSSDSRTANWHEGQLRDKEEIAVLETIDSRVMHIEWTYIVGEQKWDTSKVSEQIQALKQYFLLVNREGTPDLVTKFKFVKHGNTLMSGRIKNVNISYSKAYIGKGNDAFPLISEIKMEAKVWTSGEPQRVNIPKLLSKEPPEWA